MKNIAAADLNLLIAFDALFATRSVTLAAARIGLAQPSMSNALGRLRALMEDELFVRVPGGMRPTPLAERIAPLIAQSLAAAEAAVNHSAAFDPSTAEFEMRIAAADYFEFVLLPPLMRHLREHAPGARLRVVNADRGSVVERLDQGEIDLGIGLFPDPPKRHLVQKLLTEHFGCILRRDHPSASGKLDMQTFISLPHAMVSQKGDPRGMTDTALAELGLKREVVVTTSGFLGLPFLVASSDTIAVLPMRLAQHMATLVHVETCEPPVTLASFDLSMTWDRGADRQPHHAWLRGVLAEIAAKL